MKYFQVFVIFLFFTNPVYSRDLATWGFTGIKCKETLNTAKQFGKMGRQTLGFSIQGFLTGYNSHVMMMDLQKKSRIKAKVINKYSISEVTNILIGKCTVNPNKATYVALIEIWRTFPDARY